MANAHYSPGTDFKSRCAARSSRKLDIALREARSALKAADLQVKAGTMTVQQRAVVKGKLNNLLRQAGIIENEGGARVPRRDI